MSSTKTARESSTFTDEERAAMKERARESKASARREDGEKDVLTKIAEMPEADRVLAERVHAVVMTSAPELSPETWYGMPAYAKDGKVVCFFRSAHIQVAIRHARLQRHREPRRRRHVADGFALKQLSAAEEARISALVRQAVS